MCGTTLWSPHHFFKIMKNKNFNLKSYLSLIEENLEHELGDFIYHATDSSSGRGVVVGYRICGVIKEVEYLVNFAPGVNFWLENLMLSTTKPPDI